MESVSGLAVPPSWSYHSEDGYCEQKIVETFPLRLCRISKIVFCSSSLGFSNSHSSIISSVGLVYFSKSACHVCFAAAGGSGNEYVASIANEFAGGQSGNQVAVKLPSRRLVDFVDTCVLLFETGTLYQAILCIVPALTILDIHQ